MGNAAQNPFDFAGPGKVLCSRCGRAVPRDEIQYLAPAPVDSNALGEIVGGFVAPEAYLLRDIHTARQELGPSEPLGKGYFCPACLGQVKRERQRSYFRMMMWSSAIGCMLTLICLLSEYLDGPTAAGDRTRNIWLGVWFVSLLICLFWLVSSVYFGRRAAKGPPRNS